MSLSQQDEKGIPVWRGVIDLENQGEVGLLLHSGKIVSGVYEILRVSICYSVLWLKSMRNSNNSVHQGRKHVRFVLTFTSIWADTLHSHIKILKTTSRFWQAIKIWNLNVTCWQVIFCHENNWLFAGRTLPTYWAVCQKQKVERENL